MNDLQRSVEQLNSATVLAAFVVVLGCYLLILMMLYRIYANGREQLQVLRSLLHEQVRNSGGYEGGVYSREGRDSA